MKILMVCLGNICRSPLAEGILQAKAIAAGLNWTVDSAGTNGYHVGESPHQLSQKVAAQHGIDISNQISRQFIKDDLRDFDIIYVMATDVLTDVKSIAGGEAGMAKVKYFMDETFPGQQRDVPDPWYGGEDGYHEVYELIDKNCERIIENLAINKNKTQHT